MSQYTVPAGKNQVVTWLLWLLLGGFGVHAFYLDWVKRGLMYLGISVVAPILMVILDKNEVENGVSIIGVLVAALGLTLAVMWITDAVRIYRGFQNQASAVGAPTNTIEENH